jgi:hypothetical protein
MRDKFITITVNLKGKDNPKAENIWAKKIGKGKAEIANIPFFTRKCGLGDIVRYVIGEEGERVFDRRIKKNSNTFYIAYDKTDDEESNQKRYEEVVKHYEKYGIFVEGLIVGHAAIAVPVNFEDDLLEIAFDTQPHYVEIEY